MYSGQELNLFWLRSHLRGYGRGKLSEWSLRCGRQSRPSPAGQAAVKLTGQRCSSAGEVAVVERSCWSGVGGAEVQRRAAAVQRAPFLKHAPKRRPARQDFYVHFGVSEGILWGVRADLWLRSCFCAATCLGHSS